MPSSITLHSRLYLDFLLHHVFQLEDILSRPVYLGHDLPSMSLIVDLAEELAAKFLWPAYRDGDVHPATYYDGQVQVHPALRTFVRQFVDSGFLAADHLTSADMHLVPKIVQAVTKFIMYTGNNSFLMYTDLLMGCIHLVDTYGTAEQKEIFIPPMMSGKWLGTMCLTEPQAASNLAELTTVAFPLQDGTFSIEGQKIFISAGDHDLSENIIHFVLARIAGAPPGVKGISLFIVPKNNLQDHHVDNDVRTIGIYHKMGQKATPAAHLAFGSQQKCIGLLLGAAHQGLHQMFQLMNSSRLSVGLSGLGVASAAYHLSRQYASERSQGRSLSAIYPGIQVPIIQHPDVRHMLLDQKAIYEGGLALHMQCYYFQDLVINDVDALKNQALVDLLIPVCKTFGAEMGHHAAHQGLQVFGGYGYTSDFPLEQLARDARIMSIYEGTTGILSQALLSRQIIANQGQSMVWLRGEIIVSVQEAASMPSLQVYYHILVHELDQLAVITNHLLKLGRQGNQEALLADATTFMRYFGFLCVGWQWLKVGLCAEKSTIINASYRQTLLHTMRFYFDYQLIKATALRPILLTNSSLTHYSEPDFLFST